MKTNESAFTTSRNFCREGCKQREIAECMLIYMCVRDYKFFERIANNTISKRTNRRVIESQNDGM